MDDHAHLGHRADQSKYWIVADGSRHVLVRHDGAPEAIEEIGRDGHVTLTGHPLGHALDMGIETKRLMTTTKPGMLSTVFRGRQSSDSRR